VSLAREWGGACLNCVWSDASACCNFSVAPCTGSSSKSVNSASGKPGRQAIKAPEGGEYLSDAE
jgi:hypothetical protein